jgi:hypothetical protein
MIFKLEKQAFCLGKARDFLPGFCTEKTIKVEIQDSINA